MISPLLAILLLYSTYSFASPINWKTQIIDDAQTLYETISLAEFQKPIEFKIIKNDSITASAVHEYDKLVVEINTGLLRSLRLTPDTLRMIICHEIGHLFGGAPIKSPPPEWEVPTDQNGKSMMSAEGQADYYASTACFKKLSSLEEIVIPYAFDISRVGPLLQYKCQNLAGYRKCSCSSANL